MNVLLVIDDVVPISCDCCLSRQWM